MTKSIKITIYRDNWQIVKKSEGNVTENLVNLHSQLKTIRETVNEVLTNVINRSEVDKNTCPDSGEDDDESEENEDEKNTGETILNEKRKPTVQGLSEDKQGLQKRVKN